MDSFSIASVVRGFKKFGMLLLERLYHAEESWAILMRGSNTVGHVPSQYALSFFDVEE